MAVVQWQWNGGFFEPSELCTSSSSSSSSSNLIMMPDDLCSINVYSDKSYDRQLIYNNYGRPTTITTTTPRTTTAVLLLLLHCVSKKTGPLLPFAITPTVLVQ